MIPMQNIPVDRTTLDPWFAGLLEKDSETVAQAIQSRLSRHASPELTPLIDLISEFTPRRLHYAAGIGVVACVKRPSLRKAEFKFVATDFMAIAQPFPDGPIRPVMYEFFSKFTGSGASVDPQYAGQFVEYTAVAKDIAHYEPEKLGEWAEAGLLYSAETGDSVFINQHGATAWHSHETNEIVPLFDSFSQFIKHYVELHQKSESVDSWASRDLLGIKS